MGHYSGGGIGRVFKLVSLCVFILLIQTNQTWLVWYKDMGHYSGGGIGRVFKRVSLCVFILLMILSLAFVAKSRVEISKSLVSGNDIQIFVEMLMRR